MAVAAVLASVTGAAAQPALTTPAAAPAPAAPHAEYTVRAGIHSTELVFDDDAPKGRGPLVEGAAAWRFRPWLSAGAFAAFSRLRDSFNDPFVAAKTYTSTVLFLDLGVRFSFHLGGAFAGLGVALAKRREGGESYGGTMAELHAGYRFRPVSWLHGAPEVMVMIGRASVEQGYRIDTRRLAIGVVF